MAGRRDALIIATGSYEDEGLRQLRSPAQDAAALSRVLGDPAIGGFDVQQVVDQDEGALRRALHSFFAERSLDDLLLVHLSCHGIKDDDGRLYFAGTDTRREALEVTAVSAAFLNEQMERSRARSIVLLLDCCYAGAFAPGSKGDEGVHLKEKFEGTGRAILTASNAIEYAWEGDDLSGQGQPSVFTAAIVGGLETGAADRDGDGRVSIHELHDHITERMLEAVPRQTPLKWELGIEGGLYIARSPQPRALAPEIHGALEHPLPSVRAAVVSDLARLVDSSQPVTAQAARAALERLSDDDSLTVRRAAAAALGRPEEPAGAPSDDAALASGEPAASTPSGAMTEKAAEPMTVAPAEPRRAEPTEARPPAPPREPASAPSGEQEADTGWLEPYPGPWGSGPGLVRHRRRLASLSATLARRRLAVLGGVAIIAIAVAVPFVIDLTGRDGPERTVVVVPATQDWTDTAVDLDIGDELSIRASGEIRDDINNHPDRTFTPDGEPRLPGEHPGDPHLDIDHAALIGKIDDDGDVFFVGRSHTSDAPAAGRLWLGINDDLLDDNDGEFEATVTVTRAEPGPDE